MPEINKEIGAFIDVFAEARRLEDTDTPRIDPDPKEESKVPKHRYEAHYARYNMDDPDAVARLEKVRTECLNGNEAGTHIVTREEWVHTKDGETYVVLSWVVRYTVPVVEASATR